MGLVQVHPVMRLDQAQQFIGEGHDKKVIRWRY
jgi:hypothetical protein